MAGRYLNIGHDRFLLHHSNFVFTIILIYNIMLSNSHAATEKNRETVQLVLQSKVVDELPLTSLGLLCTTHEIRLQYFKAPPNNAMIKKR
jgi:hypothetical protein